MKTEDRYKTCLRFILDLQEDLDLIKSRLDLMLEDTCSLYALIQGDVDEDT